MLVFRAQIHADLNQYSASGGPLSAPPAPFYKHAKHKKHYLFIVLLITLECEESVSSTTPTLNLNDGHTAHLAAR
jgi:hypothetical protein